VTAAAAVASAAPGTVQTSSPGLSLSSWALTLHGYSSRPATYLYPDGMVNNYYWYGPWTYVGCFWNDLTYFAGTDLSMTVDSCAQSCGVNGYLYAGIQGGMNCYCSNSFGSRGASGSCTLRARGNPNQYGGGVYSGKRDEEPINKRQSSNLLANPGFESSPGVINGNFPGWTATNALSGSDYFINSGSPHTGTYSAWLGATGSYDDTILQTISTVAGDTYTISFWLSVAGGGNNDFQAYFGSTNLLSLTNVAAFGWTYYTYNVVATSTSTVLSFSGRNPPVWTYLDDVSVVDNTSPPATTASTASTIAPGPNSAISVYRTFRYGCFANIPYLGLPILTSSAMTPQMCITACATSLGPTTNTMQNDGYAGIQGGTTCYCVAGYPNGWQYLNVNSASTCSAPCGGNPSEVCGGYSGSGITSVYFLGQAWTPSNLFAPFGAYASAPATPPPFYLEAGANARQYAQQNTAAYLQEYYWKLFQWRTNVGQTNLATWATAVTNDVANAWSGALAFQNAPNSAWAVSVNSHPSTAGECYGLTGCGTKRNGGLITTQITGQYAKIGQWSATSTTASTAMGF